MYFATLTEVPIMQGLLGAGMGQGPSLSLPSVLVIGGELGWKKTLVYIALVVEMSTAACDPAVASLRRTLAGWADTRFLGSTILTFRFVTKVW
jgi:hypothetical protein